MTDRQKGLKRNKAILSLLDDMGLMTTEQIAGVFFSGLKFGLTKCRERMLLLYRKKQVNRTRRALEQSMIYYSEKLPVSNMLDHNINRNWLLCYLLGGAWSFDYLRFEYKVGPLQADAFCRIGGEFYFVESDRASSRNEFKKVRLYNELFESDKYSGEWWVDRVDRFPAVMIVTDGEGKRRRILEHIQRENVHGLRFGVYTVDQIREVVVCDLK